MCNAVSRLNLARVCAVPILAVFLALPHGMALSEDRIVFISHAPDADSWWNTIRNSIKHAAEDYGVRVEFRNPKDGSIEEMAKIIDAAAESKPDGIISTIGDYKVLKDPLTRVTQKYKIPLITYNSGTYEQSESVGALLHIGQPEFEAGVLAGQRAAQEGVKSFVCLNHYSNNPASHERCQGFAKGLGLSKANELTLPTDDKGIEAAITAYLGTHGNSADALLALGPQPAHATLAALKSVKIEKKPYIVTFDLSNAITSAVKAGQIAFAIDQQPYLQGYLSVAMMAITLRNKNLDLSINKLALYTNMKLHKRMSDYDIELRSFGKRHIDSGPGYVTRANAAKVEMYSGSYR